MEEMIALEALWWEKYWGLGVEGGTILTQRLTHPDPELHQGRLRPL